MDNATLLINWLPAITAWCGIVVLIPALNRSAMESARILEKLEKLEAEADPK